MNIYYLQEDSLHNSGLFNVYDRSRVNEFGEPYCVASYLTYEIAQATLDRLNSTWDTGKSGLINEKLTNTVLNFIRHERIKQDKKWGEQNHDRGMWLHILMEELGEASKEHLQGNEEEFERELFQAAAVLVAWCECNIRKNMEV